MRNILFIIFILSFQIVNAQSKIDKALIRKARQLSNEAIVKKDIEAISKTWLEEYVVIRGSGSLEIGREANIKNWKNIFAENPKTYFVRIPSEIIISKSNPKIAWESGSWKGYNTYSKGGRYSAQWQKKDGEWKMKAELFVALEKSIE